MSTVTTDQVFTLPDLGEGLVEAELVAWLVQPGDTIAVDAPIAEVETAKATVEVPSPYAGVVVTLHAEPGTAVAVGAPLITVGAATDPAAATYIEEERAGSGNVLIGYGTSADRPTRRRRARQLPPAGRPGPAASGRVRSPPHRLPDRAAPGPRRRAGSGRADRHRPRRADRARRRGAGHRAPGGDTVVRGRPAHRPPRGPSRAPHRGARAHRRDAVPQPHRDPRGHHLGGRRRDGVAGAARPDASRRVAPGCAGAAGPVRRRRPAAVPGAELPRRHRAQRGGPPRRRQPRHRRPDRPTGWSSRRSATRTGAASASWTPRSAGSPRPRTRVLPPPPS